MAHVTTYKKGQHLFQCQICARIWHSEEKRIMWNGLIVDNECWEPRHPQDFVRGTSDDRSVTDSNPEGGRKFLAVDTVSAPELTENITPNARSTTTFLEPGDVTADDL